MKIIQVASKLGNLRRIFLIFANPFSVCMSSRLWGGKHLSNSSLPQPQRRDLERAPWCYLLWGAPAVLATVASATYQASVISVTEAGLFWTLSVLWIGIGCLINARFCGRVHCMIDGILFPALSIVGILNVLSVISISCSLFWTVFLVMLAGSFLFEWLWGRYA
jgi:hypothetical protein